LERNKIKYDKYIADIDDESAVVDWEGAFGWEGEGTEEMSAAGYQEGQTATNPDTGEKIIVRGGKWESL